MPPYVFEIVRWIVVERKVSAGQRGPVHKSCDAGSFPYASACLYLNPFATHPLTGALSKPLKQLRRIDSKPDREDRCSRFWTVLRFGQENELLISGMMAAGRELAGRPAIIDVPKGKGHIVLFANNPMWRYETQGSFFLLFNAMLHYDNLGVGRRAGRPAGGPPATSAGAVGEEAQY